VLDDVPRATGSGCWVLAAGWVMGLRLKFLYGARVLKLPLR
jgi:hypothetical protein